MKNLYIDFDGVILDTINPLYKMVDDRGGDSKNFEDVNKLLKSIDYNDILSISPIINDSINCIKNIIDSKKYNVFILTHVTTLEEGECKLYYLREYLKYIPIIMVPRSLEKYEIVNPEGSILIDDYKENLRHWNEHGGISIKFDTEHISKDYITIKKLDEILNLNI